MAYDSKAVKIPKSVKRVASTIMDKHERRQYIRNFVVIAEAEMNRRNNRSRGPADNDD